MVQSAIYGLWHDSISGRRARTSQGMVQLVCKSMLDYRARTYAGAPPRGISLYRSSILKSSISASVQSSASPKSASLISVGNPSHPPAVMIYSMAQFVFCWWRVRCTDGCAFDQSQRGNGIPKPSKSAIFNE